MTARHSEGSWEKALQTLQLRFDIEDCPQTYMIQSIHHSSSTIKIDITSIQPSTAGGGLRVPQRLARSCQPFDFLGMNLWRRCKFQAGRPDWEGSNWGQPNWFRFRSCTSNCACIGGYLHAWLVSFIPFPIVLELGISPLSTCSMQ